MKYSTQSLFSTLIATLVANVAFGQFAELAPVTVTVALTKKTPTGVLYPRDENGKEMKADGTTSDPVQYSIEAADGSAKKFEMFGWKPVAKKVTNKEYIASLLEEGASLANLALMARVGLGEGEASDERYLALQYSIYVYNTRTRETVHEGPTFSIGKPIATTFSSEEWLNADGDRVKKAIKGASTYESKVSIEANGVDLTGLFSGASVDKTYLEDPDDKYSLGSIEVPAAAKVVNIIAEGEDGSTYTGTISFGASKIVLSTSP